MYSFPHQRTIRSDRMATERKRLKAIGLDQQNNNFARAWQCWHISLPSFHDYDFKKLLNSWFSFLFLSLDESFRIQLQKYSEPTDKLRLEKRELIFMRRFDRLRLRLRLCLSSLFLTKEGKTCVRLAWQPFGTQLGVITLLLKEKKRVLNYAKDVWPIPVQSQGKIAVRAWSLILEVLIPCCCFLPSLGMPVVSNQTPGDKLLSPTFFYDYTENLVS